MDSKFKVLGHAAHPVLIVFPLGLLAGAVIFDLVRMASGNAELAVVSYWMIAGGIIGGLVAAVPGFVDWLAIPPGTRAKRVGLTHALANVVGLLIFAVSWNMRRSTPGYVPDTTALVVAVAGLAVAGVAGWLGGELVERMGMSVHDGAHLDAPSSLAGRTADRR